MSKEEVFEKIIVKPPIDLTPDEYELNGKIGVYTFSSHTLDEQDSADLFKRTLLKEGCYDIEESTHCLQTENFNELLENIKLNTKGLNGLILFFSYYCENNGMINVFDGKQIISIQIQNVITKFTAYACSELKNKPKIFIFHMKLPSLLQTIQTDSANYGSTYDVTYDTPGESDMLIVYKKSENLNSLDFTQKLCKNINEYGKIEDLVSLVTCLEYAVDDSRPLVISTLTRKFYVFPSDHRGHHFHLNQHQNGITSHLDEIKNKLLKANTVGKASKNGTHPSASGTKSKVVGKTVNTRTSSNRPAPMIEPKGNASVPSTATRNRLPSTATTSDGTTNTNTRSSRSRLTSSRSDASLADKNETVTRPRWRN